MTRTTGREARSSPHHGGNGLPPGLREQRPDKADVGRQIAARILKLGDGALEVDRCERTGVVEEERLGPRQAHLSPDLLEASLRSSEDHPLDQPVQGAVTQPAEHVIAREHPEPHGRAVDAAHRQRRDPVDRPGQPSLLGRKGARQERRLHDDQIHR